MYTKSEEKSVDNENKMRAKDTFNAVFFKEIYY
jgi:hypothetical protein